MLSEEACVSYGFALTVQAHLDEALSELGKNYRVGKFVSAVRGMTEWSSGAHHPGRRSRSQAIGCSSSPSTQRPSSARPLRTPSAGLSRSHEEREFEDGEHKARPLDTVMGRDVYVDPEPARRAGHERQ